MKTTALVRYPNYEACRRRAHRRSMACVCVNAAERRYFLEKLLDAALAAVTTLGVVVILMFSFTVFT